MSDREQELIKAIQQVKRQWHNIGGVNTNEFHNALMALFLLADKQDAPPPLGVAVSEHIQSQDKLR